jgi:thioredoxin-dependent peroxiredoxin
VKSLWIIGGVLFVGLFALGAYRAFAGPAKFTIEVGQPAPNFTLPDQTGAPVTLSEFRGRWVVLYFYPKDDTPGCTKEACSFRDNLVALQQLNATVLGVSVDSVASHQEFAEKFELNFPLLADPDYAICRLYGTLTSYLGFTVASRSTVIIDPAGIVRQLFPDVKPTDHALEIHRALKQLQTT